MAGNDETKASKAKTHETHAVSIFCLHPGCGEEIWRSVGSFPNTTQSVSPIALFRALVKLRKDGSSKTRSQDIRSAISGSTTRAIESHRQRNHNHIPYGQFVSGCVIAPECSGPLVKWMIEGIEINERLITESDYAEAIAAAERQSNNQFPWPDQRVASVLGHVFIGDDDDLL